MTSYDLVIKASKSAQTCFPILTAKNMKSRPIQQFLKTSIYLHYDLLNLNQLIRKLKMREA